MPAVLSAPISGKNKKNKQHEIQTACPTGRRGKDDLITSTAPCDYTVALFNFKLNNCLGTNMQPKIAETRQVSFQRIICTIQVYDFLVTRTVGVF